MAQLRSVPLFTFYYQVGLIVWSGNDLLALVPHVRPNQANVLVKQPNMALVEAYVIDTILVALVSPIVLIK